MRGKFDIWLANLNPARGTEVGKIRPVLILQSDNLNPFHHSSIICPLSSNPWKEKLFHLPIKADLIGVEKDSVILLDQLRALDNQRLIKKLGSLPYEYHSQINQRLRIILDLT